MSRSSLFASLVLVVPYMLSAQAQAVGQVVPKSRIATWFENNNISIRKTFNGSKDEGKPAAIQWVDDDTDSNSDHYLVDVGIKVSEWEVLKDSNSSLLIYPVVEWHKLTKNPDPIDKGTGSIKAEFRPFAIRGFFPDGTPVPPSFPGQVLRTVSPLLLVGGDYTEDFEADKNEVKLSSFLTLTSNKAGLPGADFRDSKRRFRGRYYPYVGWERFDPASSLLSESVDFAVARLYLEYWPVTGLELQYLQVILDYTYRERIGGRALPQDNVDLLSAGINLYLDGRGNIALGYEYQRGEDPVQGFQFKEQSTVGIRVKF